MTDTGHPNTSMQWFNARKRTAKNPAMGGQRIRALFFRGEVWCSGSVNLYEHLEKVDKNCIATRIRSIAMRRQYWHSREITVRTKPLVKSSVTFPDHSFSLMPTIHLTQRSFSHHCVQCVTKIHVMRTLHASQLQECVHTCVRANVTFAFLDKIVFITSCQLW